MTKISGAILFTPAASFDCKECFLRSLQLLATITDEITIKIHVHASHHNSSAILLFLVFSKNRDDLVKLIVTFFQHFSNKKAA